MIVPVGDYTEGNKTVREFFGSEMTTAEYAYLFSAAICQSTQRLTITKVSLVSREDNSTILVDHAMFKGRVTDIVDALSAMKPRNIIIEGVRVKIRFTFDIEVPEHDGEQWRVKYSYPNDGTAGTYLPDQLVHVLETTANSLQSTYRKLRKRMEANASQVLVVASKPTATQGPTPEEIQFAKQAADPAHFDTRSELRFTRAMDIGPELAKQLLEHNSHNRPMRMHDVRKYVQDMQEGRWVPLLSSVGFFADGTLANGQHRLMAVIESGTVQQFNVEFGHDKESAQYIDAGRSRTFLDRVMLSDSDISDMQNMPKVLASCRVILENFRSEMQIGVDMEEAVKQYISAYKEEFAFIQAIYKPDSRGLYAAPVYAAFTTAAIAKVDREKLKTAAYSLAKFSSRKVEEYEDVTSMKKLREDLIKLRENSGNSKNKKILYMTACSLNAYLNGKRSPRTPEVQPYPFAIWTFDGLKAYDPGH